MGVQINGSEGNVIATKGTYSGNVTIGGTLTYEDVTNIDSVGLVTARTGIEIGARPGVAASISIDGNAIFSGITTIATLRATTGIVTAFQGDVVIEDKIIHSGDTNTAIRFPAADTITAETAGSERLRVGSGGDVSVGGHATNYADSPLEVRGTNAGGDVAIRVTNNSTTAGTQAGVIFTTTTSDFTTAGIGYERGGTADALRFYVGQSDAAGGFDNATERLRIASNGRIGIGTQTPESLPLTVAGSTAAIALVDTDRTNSNYYSAVWGDQVGNLHLVADYEGAAGSQFITARIGGTALSNEKLRIDSDGRLIVGGGTHAGGSALVVKGGNQNTYSTIGMFGNQSNPASGVLAQLRMGANTTAVGADIRAVADNQWGSSDYPTRLEFGTVSDGSSSRTERMRIISNGHTKITNNGTYQSSTGTFHEMRNSSTNQHIMWLTHTGIGDVQYGIRIQTANEQNDTTHNYIDCREGGSVTRRFIVYANGNVQNQNNSYGSLSDEKLKENITDANSQWDDIKALKVRNFNFTNDSNKVKCLGLVAQEAETVCPSLVFTSPDTEDDSETGQIKETGTETKSLKYSVLYMKAIKCLQEAQTRIETLETEVAALKSS